jgi:hypothetical protein
MNTYSENSLTNPSAGISPQSVFTPDKSYGIFRCLAVVDSPATAAVGIITFSWTDRGGAPRSRSSASVSLIAGATIELDVKFYTDEDNVNHDSEVVWQITLIGILGGLSYSTWHTLDVAQGV